SAPFSNTFRPVGDLRDFNNVTKSGTWSLWLEDTAQGDTGTLLNWSIITRHLLTPDCNSDGTPDSCQLSGLDCNTNLIMDMCEFDCDTNATPDDCDLAAGAFDCNTNQTIDVCDFFDAILGTNALTTPVAIQDNAVATASLTLLQQRLAMDINVRINIQHT